MGGIPDFFVPRQVTASYTSASDTNSDEYSVEMETPPGTTGMQVFIKRTADTGTCTLDAYLQAREPQSYGGTAVYVETTVAIVPQFADGVTTTRVASIAPGITGSDSDGMVVSIAGGAAAGAHLINTHIPHRWRLRYRNGGTTVTNTFSVWVVYIRA